MSPRDPRDPDAPDRSSQSDRHTSQPTALDALGWELLARYFADAASDADVARVRAWLGSDLARRRELEALRAAWYAAELPAADPDPVTPPDVDDAWRAMVGRMDAASIRTARLASPAPRRTPPSIAAPIARGSWHSVRWSAAAAALIALVATGFALRDRLASPFHAIRSAAVPRVTEFATNRGQRAEVRLADGSTVSLNVESRLRYMGDFGAGRREVELDGEAFFNVVHDATRPFIVRTARGVARDIGTKFAVTAYPEMRTMTVLVTQGAVALAPGSPRGAVNAGAPNPTARAMATSSNELILHAADLGRVMSDGRLTVRHNVDTAARTAWMEGRLVFDNTPLRDAVMRLDRWYDVDVRLGDPAIGGLLLSGPLGADSPSETITMITTVLHLTAVWNGGTVTLYPTRDPRGNQ